MTTVNANKRVTKCYYGINEQKKKCKRIDAINIMQYKNFISVLKRLIIEKSKTIIHLAK